MMKLDASLLIRILTHNIRYATDSPFKGEKPWPKRRDLIINELKYNTLYNPEAFVCLQEVLHNQLTDILTGLNGTMSATAPSPSRDEWAYIGVGRDDGYQEGEYSPILYRPSVWAVKAWKTVWLSPTPGQPGLGWDATSVRIVTVGTFVHRVSKREVVGLCTHFDDSGTVSRRESAKLVLRIVDEITSAAPGESRLPIWLAGDLNSPPEDEAYQILNEEGSLLKDSRGLAQWRYGDENTFTGFEELEEELTLLDFVFVGRNGWDIKGSSVLSNRFEDGVYNSDHRAVVVDTVLDA
jgi:endonuclease/exonuclease/phosphatase family metal-dependent hydrolase